MNPLDLNSIPKFLWISIDYRKSNSFMKLVNPLDPLDPQF